VQKPSSSRRKSKRQRKELRRKKREEYKKNLKKKEKRKNGCVVKLKPRQTLKRPKNSHSLRENLQKQEQPEKEVNSE